MSACHAELKKTQNKHNSDLIKSKRKKYIIIIKMQSNIDILYKFTHKPSDVHTLTQQKFTHTLLYSLIVSTTHTQI